MKAKFDMRSFGRQVSISEKWAFGVAFSGRMLLLFMIIFFNLVLKHEALCEESLNVDLTYSFDSTTIYWPTESGFVLEERQEFRPRGHYYYSAGHFHGAEHGGTHLDAPRHFAEGHKTVDELALSQLQGEAVVVDVQHKTRKRADYQIRVEDFLEWEKRHGRIPEGSVVLLRTGYGRYWPDAQAYLGTVEKGAEAVKKLRFPGLSPMAARWLVEQRHIKMVGIDTASIDYGPSKDFLTHRIFANHDVPILENLASLDQLPSSGFKVIALPMKIKGASGAPTRVMALVSSSPTPR